MKSKHHNPTLKRTVVMLEHWQYTMLRNMSQRYTESVSSIVRRLLSHELNNQPDLHKVDK